MPEDMKMTDADRDALLARIDERTTIMSAALLALQSELKDDQKRIYRYVDDTFVRKDRFSATEKTTYAVATGFALAIIGAVVKLTFGA